MINIKNKTQTWDSKRKLVLYELSWILVVVLFSVNHLLRYPTHPHGNKQTNTSVTSDRGDHVYRNKTITDAPDNNGKANNFPKYADRSRGTACHHLGLLPEAWYNIDGTLFAYKVMASVPESK